MGIRAQTHGKNISGADWFGKWWTGDRHSVFSEEPKSFGPGVAKRQIFVPVSNTVTENTTLLRWHQPKDCEDRDAEAEGMKYSCLKFLGIVCEYSFQSQRPIQSRRQSRDRKSRLCHPHPCQSGCPNDLLKR